MSGIEIELINVTQNSMFTKQNNLHILTHILPITVPDLEDLLLFLLLLPLRDTLPAAQHRVVPSCLLAADSVSVSMVCLTCSLVSQNSLDGTSPANASLSSASRLACKNHYEY